MRGILLLLGASWCAVGQSTDASLKFDVASLKPAGTLPGGVMAVARKGPAGAGRATPASPGHFTRRNASLANLIMLAYGLKPQQVTGPDWINTERYDIDARASEGATSEQQMVMLQNLLAERFRLKVHREPKQMSIYEMVVAKGGVKLKESVAGPDALPEMRPGGPFQVGFQDGATMVRLREQGTMDALATRLSSLADRIIVNRTGLKGTYDVVMHWTPPMSPGATDAGAGAAADPGLTIPVAFESQLGIKLEAKKGPVEVLVVDSAEKVPTEN